MSELATIKLTSWSDLVGRRLLIREVQCLTGDTTTEVRLQELAPSGRYMRLRWMTERITWEPTAKYELVELLPGELPTEATEPAGGLEVIARSVWWRYTKGSVCEIVRADDPDEMVEEIMGRWDASPYGSLFGFDVKDRPIGEIVNGTGHAHRAAFEQSVRAWLAIHWHDSPV